MIDQLKKMGAIFTTLTSIISLLATIVYLTWYQASLDKRTSLLEQEVVELTQQLNSLSYDEDQNHERTELELESLYETLIKGN